MYGCTSFNPNWISFQTSSMIVLQILTYVLCLSFLGIFLNVHFLFTSFDSCLLLWSRVLIYVKYGSGVTCSML